MKTARDDAERVFQERHPDRGISRSRYNAIRFPSPQVRHYYDVRTKPRPLMMPRAIYAFNAVEHDALQHVALDRVRALYVSGARLTRRDWHALAWPLDGATLLIVHGLYAPALLPKLLRVKRLVPPPPMDPDDPSGLPRGMLRRPATVTAPPADSDSGDDAEAAPPRWGRVVLPHLMELWLQVLRQRYSCHRRRNTRNPSLLSQKRRQRPQNRRSLRYRPRNKLDLLPLPFRKKGQ